ncbi:MAG: insulinase family protein, partial [Bacteroidetes bacterium]|nr:insulinase family protein [Bacteroidota bacterium]
MSIDRKKGPAGITIGTLNFPHAPELDLGPGLKGWLYPTKETGVARLYIVFPGGTKRVKESWILRAAAHLQLSGNSAVSALQIMEQLEAIGASIDIQVESRYVQLVISAQTRHLHAALDIWLKYSAGVGFPQKEVEVYKAGAVSDLQIRQSTPKYWSHRLLMQSICGSEHYLSNYTEVSDIQGISADQLHSYSSLFLDKQPCFMILCGDVDEAVFTQLAHQWGPVSLDITEPPIWTKKPSEQRHIEHPVANTNQVSLSLGKSGVVVHDSDYCALWLLNTLLGGFFGSRLMKNIREERGLTYGIHSSLVNHGDEYHWYIHSEIKAGNAELVIKEIKHELNRLMNDCTQPDELNKVKQYLCGNLKMSFDGPFNMAGKRRDLTLFGRDYNFYDRAIESIHNVEAGHIQELA